MYKLKNVKGGIVNGTANLDFLPSKYKEKQEIKYFNFSKFTSGISEESSSRSIMKKGILASNSNFEDDENGNVNPIQLDHSDLNFGINNNDAITFNFRKNNNNN